MRLYISLFLVTLCLSSFVPRNLTEEVAKTYTSQIGVREKTGHNDGQEVEKYLKSVSLGKGYAWCAAFIAWTYDQQNIKHPRSAWTPAWFPTANVIYKQGKSTHASVPGRADVFGIYFSNKKRIAHVGFIDQWNQAKGVAITVEGNTNDAGSREGDGVYRKRRQIRQIYAVSRWL